MKSLGIALSLMVISLITAESSMAEDVFDATNDRAYSIPNADAPELAYLGKYAVGVTEHTFVDPARPSIVEALAGREPLAAREVPVTIWYPVEANSTVEGAETATYTGKLPFRPGVRPEGVPETYNFGGIAIRDAKPFEGDRLPLIVLSHGYGNWATFLSYLGENLASKGYVVASIEHNDLPYTDFASFGVSFGNTILNRTRDQRLVIEKLVEMAAGENPVGRLIDAEAIGLIGYSMGGFGALASAGAGYDASSPSLNQIPAAMLAGLLEGEDFTAPHPALKAVVAVSPWGAAPDSRAWNMSAFKNISIPLFFIAGDHDDISGFEEGVKWIYDNANGTERHMLVFENGRHSIGGNPEPPIADDHFDLTDWFNEPVWRRDRVVGINQHFITAFMNQHLKNDPEAADFMNVSPLRSNDGEWPIPAGGYVGGAFSSGDHDGLPYWKGFQRRFALGLQMLRANADQ